MSSVFYSAIWFRHIRHKVHKGTEFGNDLLSCVLQCIKLLFCVSHNAEFDKEFMYFFLIHYDFLIYITTITRVMICVIAYCHVSYSEL